VEAERQLAPDKRFLLSHFRTPSSVKSVKFHRAVTGPAVAIVAAVAGTAGAWSAGAAGQPAAIATPASLVRPLAPVQTGPGPSPSSRQPASLDAFFATASKPGSKPAELTADGAARRRARAALTPRGIARRLLHRFHWSPRQFRYLDPLWARESSWNVRAENPYSGAYGIPQAVPGSKMASAGPRWQSSARTQILWGLRYIKSRYGSPAAAWAHEEAAGWY
jgi:peptidoglycan DL-endopeptidase CwlO